MRRITTFESIGCFNIFCSHNHEHVSLISVDESFHLSCTNKSGVILHTVSSHNVLHPIFGGMVLVLMTEEYFFSIIQVWASQYDTADIKRNNI